MTSRPNTRWWHGLEDSVHPLQRTAHTSIAYGRYIYVLNGYAPVNNEMCMFDRAGLTVFDPQSKTVHFLPVHWNYSSLQQNACTPPMLSTSGGAAAIDPTGPRIYSFGGFSLLGGFHTNTLTCITLPKSTNFHTTPSTEIHVQLKPACCHASVLSGHGTCSYLFSLNTDTMVPQTLLYMTLRCLQHQSESRDVWHKRHVRHHALPSPRDKMSMEYWRGCLYVYGGYGPNFTPPSYWPSGLLQWPFLCNPDGTKEWFPCEGSSGWNNQLLIFNLARRRWSLVCGPQDRGQRPSARAAHQSTLVPERGWMLVFGGRGPVHDSPHSDSGRLNDLFCLDLNLLEWTRVVTPAEVPSIARPLWPPTRSWMGMSSSLGLKYHRGSECFCQLHEKRFPADPSLVTCSVDVLISGGYSNSSEPLSDAYLLRVSSCPEHHQFEAAVVARCDADSTPTISSYTLPLPEVIDGFACPSEPPTDVASILRINRNESEFTVLHQTDSHPEGLCSEQSSVRPAYIAYFLNNYLSMSLSSDVSDILPRDFTSSQPFFHIASKHADLVLFLLCQFCVYDVCHHDDEELDTPEPNHISGESFKNDIVSACETLLRLIGAETQTLSFLIRVLLRFMLPWEPIGMMLHEGGAWFSRENHTLLLSQLTSDYAATPPETVIELNLSKRSLLDKIALLLPVDRVHVPAPFHNHVVDRHGLLSYHVQYTVISFLLWCGKGPLTLNTSDVQIPKVAVTQTSVELRHSEPCPRFWHTLTATLDGSSFYAIGGLTRQSITAPIERLCLAKPLELSVLCLRSISTWIIEHCPSRAAKVNHQSETCTASPGSSTLVLDMHSCSCARCTRLFELLDCSTIRKLSRWLK